MDDALPLEEDPLVSRVAALIGAATPDDARRALRATLTALGGLLPPAERGTLGAALPRRYKRCVGARRLRAMDVDRFFALARRGERVAAGFAREHVQVVCRVLGELLSPAARETVVRSLPAPIAELFAEPPRTEAPPHASAPSTRGHTLATGQPGSSHPLSTSKPEDAHAASVARDGEPHPDTKRS